MKELLKRFLVYSLGSYTSLILSVGATVIITRVLDPEELAKMSLVILTINLLSLFSYFGVDQSFVRNFYNTDQLERQKLFGNCFSISLVVTVVLSILLYLLRSNISVLLLGYHYNGIVLLVIVGIITQLIFRYFTLILRMKQDAKSYSIVQVLNKTLYLAFVLIVASYPFYDFRFFTGAYVVSFFSAAIFAVFKSKEYVLFLDLKNTKLSKNIELVKFGLPLMITTLITWLLQATDKIAIRSFSNLHELGIYAGAMNIVAIVTVLQTSFATFWVPVSYERFNLSKESHAFFSNVNLLVSFVMLFASIMTIMLKDLIILILGSKYSDAAIIVPFLVFMPILSTVSETTIIGVNFYKKTNWHILIAIIALFFNIIGNVILVPIFGALGASISTAVSYFIFFIVRTFIGIQYFNPKFYTKKFAVSFLLVFSYAVFTLRLEAISITLTGFLLLLFLTIYFLPELSLLIRTNFKAELYKR